MNFKLLSWCITAVILTLISVIMLVSMLPSSTKVYDCSMSEFHPDFPAKVKEECRRLRSKTWT